MIGIYIFHVNSLKLDYEISIFIFFYGFYNYLLYLVVRNAPVATITEFNAASQSTNHAKTRETKRLNILDIIKN